MQLTLFEGTEKRAEMSDCTRYRYYLNRVWDREKAAVVFLMLNPSTADAYQDDRTIRRCIAFAKRWGYGGLLVLNVFAHRSTDPRVLAHLFDPVGPENDAWISAICEGMTVVCAWGQGGSLNGRAAHVLRLLEGKAEIMCLKRNEDGSPMHPLYCPRGTDPVPYLP